MKGKKAGVILWAVLLLAGVALAVPWRSAQEETPVRDTAVGDALEKSCQVTQTMRFSRCGHSVTRRVGAPDTLEGASLEQARAYYAAWHIDALSPREIDMRRDIELFCPMHQVLMSDEMGNLARFVNRYGDGMACEERYDVAVSAFPEGVRAQLIAGLAFDDAESLEAWLAEYVP